MQEINENSVSVVASDFGSINIEAANELNQSGGFCCLGLDNPKTSANVGSVLRAAGCYNVAMVAVSGRRYKLSATDAQKAYRKLPFLQVEDLRAVIPYDCVPVAIELIAGATPLTHYQHPERAFYIFGAEDATLGNRITGWCRDIVYIPTKSCMNLAATVNVVLYDRLSKTASLSSRQT